MNYNNIYTGEIKTIIKSDTPTFIDYMTTTYQQKLSEQQAQSLQSILKKSCHATFNMNDLQDDKIISQLYEAITQDQRISIFNQYLQSDPIFDGELNFNVFDEMEMNKNNEHSVRDYSDFLAWYNNKNNTQLIQNIITTHNIDIEENKRIKTEKTIDGYGYSFFF
jgi:hypothetical protein